MIARAYDQHLYWSDLRRAIPLDATPEDSAARAQAIIDAWLREQVVLHTAERNLGPDQKDLEARLRDYRNSLIVYAYESALIDQKLDTTIGGDEIQRYYEENRENFILKDNIVRARWFRIRDDDQRTLKQVEQWFRSDTEKDRHELEVWLAGHRVEPHDSGSDWWSFKELQKEVPIETQNPVDFLSAQPRQRLVLKDSLGTCFVDILEHRLQEGVSPLRMVRDEIRAVLLNQRKQLLIQRMRDDLYRNAREQKDIEVH